MVYFQDTPYKGYKTYPQACISLKDVMSPSFLWQFHVHEGLLGLKRCQYQKNKKQQQHIKLLVIYFGNNIPSSSYSSKTLKKTIVYSA